MRRESKRRRFKRISSLLYTPEFSFQLDYNTIRWDCRVLHCWVLSRGCDGGYGTLAVDSAQRKKRKARGREKKKEGYGGRGDTCVTC